MSDAELKAYAEHLQREHVRYNLEQNTKKVSLNSCYGAVGNEHHRFFDVRQAEAVTMTGQMIIRYVADCVNRCLNSEFGTNTDYVLASDTDSVAGDSVIVVNNTPITIADYFDAVSGPYLRNDEFNKQWVKRVDVQDVTPSIDVASASIVDRPIKYVMKHTVKKSLYRVTTPQGVVVVTADHSLMAYDTLSGDVVEIKPADIDVKRHRLLNRTREDNLCQKNSMTTSSSND